jgi:hypothetical protein
LLDPKQEEPVDTTALAASSFQVVLSVPGVTFLDGLAAR